jgi:hypothetical protein
MYSALETYGDWLEMSDEHYAQVTLPKVKGWCGGKEKDCDTRQESKTGRPARSQMRGAV